MAEQTAEQEPTMEEILASIRRIISEDDEQPAEGEAVAEEAEAVEVEEPAAEEPAEEAEEEVLELTERVQEEPAPEPEPEPEPVAAEPEDDLVVVDEEPAMEAPMETPVAAVEDELVSEPVAHAAASAFGDLVGQMLVSSRSTEGKTLEDIVRELLKPMLRDWLDTNLRQIVENKVADEVEKIAARARH